MDRISQYRAWEQYGQEFFMRGGKVWVRNKWGETQCRISRGSVASVLREASREYESEAGWDRGVVELIGYICGGRRWVVPAQEEKVRETVGVVYRVVKAMGYVGRERSVVEWENTVSTGREDIREALRLSVVLARRKAE